MPRYELTVSNLEHDEDYLYVTFKKPKGLSYENGQYGVFLFVNKDIEGRKMRPFSFASSNQEDVLMIGTKVSDSSFKQTLNTIKVGEKMTVDGPMGNFGLEPRKERVFIAGGIGITPIRAMLRGMDRHDNATLIFSEAREIYPFLADIQIIDDLDLQLASGRPRTQFLIEQAAKLHQNDAVYYVCGSISFVNGVTQQLRDFGITTNNIKFDRFTGY